MALPGFVWVKIESPAAEVDRRLEVFDIPEPPSCSVTPRITRSSDCLDIQRFRGHVRQQSPSGQDLAR